MSAIDNYSKNLDWSCEELTIPAGTGLVTLHLSYIFSFPPKLIFCEVLIGRFDLTL